HIAVRMHGEALTGRNPVFIDHAQRTETHKVWIMILIERKGMASIEPAMVAPATLITSPNLDHNAPVTIQLIREYRCWTRQNDSCPNSTASARLERHATSGQAHTLRGSLWLPIFPAG